MLWDFQEKTWSEIEPTYSYTYIVCCLWAYYVAKYSPELIQLMARHLPYFCIKAGLIYDALMLLSLSGVHVYKYMPSSAAE